MKILLFGRNLNKTKQKISIDLLIVVIAARCRVLFFIPTFFQNQKKVSFCFCRNKLDIFYKDQNLLSKKARIN